MNKTPSSLEQLGVLIAFGVALFFLSPSISAMFAAGANGTATQSTSSSYTPSYTPPPPKKPDIEVLWHKWKHDDGLRYIVGEAQNTGDSTLRAATVDFNLYDKNHTQVGTATDSTFNLAAHGKWAFKCYVSEGGELWEEYAAKRVY